MPRGIHETLDSFVLTRFEQNAVEYCICHLGEEPVNLLHIPPSDQEAFHLDQYEYMTSFFYAALESRHQRARVCAFTKEELYSRNIMWPASSVKKMFLPVRLGRKDAVKDACWHGKKMSYQGSGPACRTQKWAALLGTGYAASESFADQRHFPRKLLESAALPGNHEKMSLHAYTAWIYSTLHGKEGLKEALNTMHWIPNFQQCDSRSG